MTWQTLALALAAGLAAAVAFFVLRRALGWLLGPIFTYETVRLARKGHTFWLRIIFALLMLGLLYAAKPSHDPFRDPRIVGSFATKSISGDFYEPPSAVLEQFAAEFSHSFLLVLAIAVTLITPLYLATTISEEKEKRTLDFLLATHLNSRQIVLGKLAARLLNLFGVLLAGLPILAITQLWGGVDWKQMLFGFAIIITAMVSYGCISLLASVTCSKTRTAVIVAYVCVIASNFCSISSPIMEVLELRDLKPTGAAANSSYRVLPAVVSTTYIGIHLLLILFCTISAIMSLRFFAARHAGKRRRVFSARDNVAFVPHPMTVAVNPPIMGDPLVWKERYIGRTFGGWVLNSVVWIFYYLLMVIFVVVAATFASMSVQAMMYSSFGVGYRVMTVLLGVLVVAVVGLRMAGCVSREREQQTLLSLRMLPIRSSRILWAKWVGTLLRARRALIGLAATFIAAGLALGIQTNAWILLPLTFIAHVWFVGNLGLFLSVACRSTNRAYSLLLALLLAIIIGAWIASYFGPHVGVHRWSSDGLYLHDEERYRILGDHEASDIDDWLSPPQTWWRLLIRGKLIEEYRKYSLIDTTTSQFSQLGFVASALGYLLVGTILWFASCIHFRRARATE